MTVAYEDLHHLVDRLTPDQADAVRAVVLQLVVTPSASPAHDAHDESGESVISEGSPPVRRLSFAGLLHSGVGDLAARSEDILRDEFGHHSA